MWRASTGGSTPTKPVMLPCWTRQGPRGWRAPRENGPQVHPAWASGPRGRKAALSVCCLTQLSRTGQKQGDGFQPRKGLWEDGTVGRSEELDPGLSWLIPTRENESCGGELGSSPLTSKHSATGQQRRRAKSLVFRPHVYDASLRRPGHTDPVKRLLSLPSKPTLRAPAWTRAACTPPPTPKACSLIS